MNGSMFLRIAVLQCFLVALPVTAQVTVNRTDAIDSPSKHAWDLFLLLNHPAKDPKLGLRGAPDSAKKIGDPGVVVWETWRAATPEVYTVDGSRPPQDFNDLSLANSCPSGKVSEPPTKNALVKKLTKKSAVPLFNPNEGIGAPGSGGFGETRINKEAYDFILANNLYNQEGIIAYAGKVISGEPFINFPVSSIEVKAAWIEFTPAEVKAGLDAKYYNVDWSGRKFGLQTLHISTKDLPNWFWATFHHKNEVGHVFDGASEKHDSAGPPAQLKGTVWNNYVLGGTQTDFTDSIGRPDFLADAYIEQDFKKSSCITCHARASRSPAGGSLSPSNPIAGTPNPILKPSNFLDANGKLLFAPIDFVWSTIRAQKTNPNAKLPDPCSTLK